MRLKAYEESEDAERTNLLEMCQCVNNEIRFRVVDENGNGVSAGGLFKLTPDGIELFPNVNPHLGFPLDKGRLKVVE